MNTLDIACIATLAAQGLIVRVLPNGSVEVCAAEPGANAAKDRRAARNRRQYEKLKLKAAGAVLKKAAKSEGVLVASESVLKASETSESV